MRRAAPARDGEARTLASNGACIGDAHKDTQRRCWVRRAAPQPWPTRRTAGHDPTRSSPGAPACLRYRGWLCWRTTSLACSSTLWARRAASGDDACRQLRQRFFKERADGALRSPASCHISALCMTRPHPSQRMLGPPSRHSAMSLGAPARARALPGMAMSLSLTTTARRGSASTIPHR
jgi:hypothetical protein